MSRTKRILTVAVATTWAVLLLGGAFRPQGYSPGGPPRPQVGYQAPDLTVFNPNLEPITLADLRGKAVFLNFWASWCGPCRMEMPEIQRLYDSLPEGAAILAVNMTNQEQSPETPLQYMRENGYAFPIALDQSGAGGQAFQALSLPTSLFISPDGLVTARISGPLTQRAMTEYLAGAAAAKPGGPKVNGPQEPPISSLGAYLPEAFRLGPAVLPTRTLAWLLGALVAYILAGHWAGWRSLEAPGSKLRAEAAQDLVLNLTVGGVLGAKLLYVILDPAAYLKSPSLLIAFPYGTLALPGAVAGGVALAAWGLRRNRQRLLLLDQVAPALVLGAAVGTLGSPDPGLVALGPLLLAASAVAFWLRTRAAQPGQALAATAIITALAIALGDLTRPAATAGGVTTLQLICALAGTTAYLWLLRPASESRQPH